MSWIEVYTQCMDGEWFKGERCPNDGSTSRHSVELQRLTAQMRGRGEGISVQSLLNNGFDGEWSEVIVMEFRERVHAPDLLFPAKQR